MYPSFLSVSCPQSPSCQYPMMPLLTMSGCSVSAAPCVEASPGSSLSSLRTSVSSSCFIAALFCKQRNVRNTVHLFSQFITSVQSLLVLVLRRCDRVCVQLATAGCHDSSDSTPRQPEQLGDLGENRNSDRQMASIPPSMNNYLQNYFTLSSICIIFHMHEKVLTFLLNAAGKYMYTIIGESQLVCR